MQPESTIQPFLVFFLTIAFIICYVICSAMKKGTNCKFTKLCVFLSRASILALVLTGIAWFATLCYIKQGRYIMEISGWAYVICSGIMLFMMLWVFTIPFFLNKSDCCVCRFLKRIWREITCVLLKINEKSQDINGYLVFEGLLLVLNMFSSMLFLLVLLHIFPDPATKMDNIIFMLGCLFFYYYVLGDFIVVNIIRKIAKMWKECILRRRTAAGAVTNGRCAVSAARIFQRLSGVNGKG